MIGMPKTRDAQPMAEINTTPLIDVMLVLLIMFLIALPVATHKVPVTLPVATTEPGEPPETRRLDIAANGAIFWEGAPLAERDLPLRLEQLRTDPSVPLLQINADSEARYEQVDRLLASIARADIERLSFSGLGNFSDSF